MVNNNNNNNNNEMKLTDDAIKFLFNEANHLDPKVNAVNEKGELLCAEQHRASYRLHGHCRPGRG